MPRRNRNAQKQRFSRKKPKRKPARPFEYNRRLRQKWASPHPDRGPGVRTRAP
jgi:hypothetical protein